MYVYMCMYVCMYVSLSLSLGLVIARSRSLSRVTILSYYIYLQISIADFLPCGILFGTRVCPGEGPDQTYRGAFPRLCCAITLYKVRFILPRSR